VREPERNVVYFSLDGNSPLVASHVAGGGTAYYLKDGWIVEATGNVAHLFIRVSDIPLTMGGAAEFQVANVLAASAAARAYGLSREQVAASMKSFASDEDNPGRANLYEVNGGYVMVDYGHNPDAFAAVCRMAARWEGRRVTGIIGVPGDRDDSVIEQAGRVAARGFRRVIIKEDEDLRGREKGEVARLLCEAVNDESPDTECQIVRGRGDAGRSGRRRLLRQARTRAEAARRVRRDAGLFDRRREPARRASNGGSFIGARRVNGCGLTLFRQSDSSARCVVCTIEYG
jgi:cyanophycin synthetase